MSAHQELIQTFKKSLRAVTQAYEKSFTDRSKSVPEARAHDILQLESLWSTQEDPFKLRFDTQVICQGFKTGLLGRSELRMKLLAVIRNPLYSHHAFYTSLQQENQELRSQIRLESFATSTVAAMSGLPAPESLQQQIQELLQKNSQLRQSNEQLLQENQVLKQTIVSIREANQRLSSQVQNLHTRLVKLERLVPNHDDDEVIAGSPSSTLASQFSSLSRASSSAAR